MSDQGTARRTVLKTAGAALTTNLFTGAIKGANDKVRVAWIGVGRMGSSNLGIGGRQPGVEVAGICDVFEPNLENAVSYAKKSFNASPKVTRDFREILADKSIDAVCISTPDHWHAYMAVEACKAGKDVYVEKPVSLTVEEGVKMVQAARKYNRVVQAGTMQRSGVHFQKAVDIVKSGRLGDVTFVRTWNCGNSPKEGIGNPADSKPPATLNWDMWLGPAPQRAYNANRFGVDQEQVNKQRWFPNFRWFWDYAGGMMTDWGVHWLDIVQMAFDEKMPQSITALGGRLYLEDNRETPDLIQVTYQYPGFVATYENRNSNGNTGYMIKVGNEYKPKNGGISFHGSKATLFVDRSEYVLTPERGGGEPDYMESPKRPEPTMNDNHWANFLQCIKTRERPQSDIEKCQRSTTTCLLGNVAYRSGLRIDWDEKDWTTKQAEARKFLSRPEREPWKIKV